MKWQSAIGYALVVLGFSGSSLAAPEFTLKVTVVAEVGSVPEDGETDSQLGTFVME
jgi:hypothetical protein